jgi:hypothetical protein
MIIIISGHVFIGVRHQQTLHWGGTRCSKLRINSLYYTRGGGWVVVTSHGTTRRKTSSGLRSSSGGEITDRYYINTTSDSSFPATIPNKFLLQ